MDPVFRQARGPKKPVILCAKKAFLFGIINHWFPGSWGSQGSWWWFHFCCLNVYPIFGEMIQFDFNIFLDGLVQPPTIVLLKEDGNFHVPKCFFSRDAVSNLFHFVGSCQRINPPKKTTEYFMDRWHPVYLFGMHFLWKLQFLGDFEVMHLRLSLLRH